MGVHLVFNFGASNDLARQIEAGNKADVFFSADEAWMDHVAQAGLADAESRMEALTARDKNLIELTQKIDGMSKRVEALFVSAAHTDADIDATIATARESVAAISN